MSIITPGIQKEVADISEAAGVEITLYVTTYERCGVMHSDGDSFPLNWKQDVSASVWYGGILLKETHASVQAAMSHIRKLAAGEMAPTPHE